MTIRNKLAHIANTTNDINMANNLTMIVEGLDKRQWDKEKNNQYYAVFKKTELIATVPLTIDKINFVESQGYHVRKL